MDITDACAGLRQVSEVGTLSQVFQWRGDSVARTLPNFSQTERGSVSDILSEVSLSAHACTLTTWCRWPPAIFASWLVICVTGAMTEETSTSRLLALKSDLKTGVPCSLVLPVGSVLVGSGSTPSPLHALLSFAMSKKGVSSASIFGVLAC